VHALTPSLSLTPDRMLPGHRVRPLFGGTEAYPGMLEAIAAARTEICLETYIWADDANGRRFVDAVCIKAQEGVRVRCIIDGVGSFGFSGALIDRMRDAGVLLSVFHPVGPWRRHWGWQVRDHRKILIVDARVAFTGGMNLADDYAPVEWGGRGWNDVHARVEGPAVGELQRLFEVSWHYSEPENWTRPAGRLLAPHPQPVPVHGSPTRVQALAVGGFLGRRAIERHLRYAILNAQSRILIEAAYFVPGRVLRASLKLAARRGVDVRVMVPRDSDVAGVAHAGRATWATLLKAGVRIFEWWPTMLHAKTIVIDGVWSTIGSYNLDQRSLQYNWEVSLEILDRDVAGRLEERFGQDLVQCDEVSYEEFKRRGLWRRIQERFFYLFRVWL
jgi:cardiolipin synthase